MRSPHELRPVRLQRLHRGEELLLLDEAVDERRVQLAGAPERLTIDLDATLITAHSEKDQAAGTFKGGYGFAPMLAYADQTGEALAGQLRPGNGSVTRSV